MLVYVQMDTKTTFPVKDENCFNLVLSLNWEVVSSVDTQSVQEIYDRSILLDGSNIRGCLFLPTIQAVIAFDLKDISKFIIANVTPQSVATCINIMISDTIAN